LNQEKSGFAAAAFFAGFAVFAAIGHFAFCAFLTLAVFAAGCHGFAVLAALAAFHAFAIFTAVASSFAAILVHGAFAVFAAVFAIAAFLTGHCGFGCCIFAIILAALVEFLVYGIWSSEVLGVIPCIGHRLLDLFIIAALIAYGEDFCFRAPIGFGGAGFFSSRFNGLLTHAAVTPNLDVLGFGLLGKRRKRQEKQGEKAERK
jgi:hypothetical protein